MPDPGTHVETVMSQLHDLEVDADIFDRTKSIKVFGVL
jgi:hypothetical protein